MPETALITDAKLANARGDAAFRQRLVSQYLELLLGELNKLRAMSADPVRARQIREGIELAARLADLLQAISRERPPVFAASERKTGIRV